MFVSRLFPIKIEFLLEELEKKLMIITALNNKEEEVVLQAMKKEARGKCRMQMEGTYVNVI